MPLARVDSPPSPRPRDSQSSASARRPSAKKSSPARKFLEERLSRRLASSPPRDDHEIQRRRQAFALLAKDVSQAALDSRATDGVTHLAAHSEPQPPPSKRVGQRQQNKSGTRMAQAPLLNFFKISASEQPTRRRETLTLGLTPRHWRLGAQNSGIPAQGNSLLGRGNDETATPLGATALEDFAARRGRIALAETMRAVPLDLARLIGRLSRGHDVNSLLTRELAARFERSPQPRLTADKALKRAPQVVLCVQTNHQSSKRRRLKPKTRSFVKAGQRGISSSRGLHPSMPARSPSVRTPHAPLTGAPSRQRAKRT